MLVFHLGANAQVTHNRLKSWPMELKVCCDPFLKSAKNLKPQHHLETSFFFFFNYFTFNRFQHSHCVTYSM